MWAREEMEARYKTLSKQRFASGVALRRARKAEARTRARIEGLHWAISKFYPMLTASPGGYAEENDPRDPQAPASVRELISARDEAIREADAAAKMVENHASDIMALDRDMRGLERLMWGYHRVALEPPSEEEMSFAAAK